MSSEPTDLHDDVLDRAVLAVRELPGPDGPSALLAERTRQALRVRSAAADAAAAPRGLWRWAAVLLVGGSAAAAAIVGRELLNRGSADNQIARQSPVPGGNPTAPAVAPPPGPMLVSNPPPLVGVVRIEGPVPPPLPVAAAVGPDCGHGHPPVKDESIVAGPGGTLGNVVVCVSAGLAPDRTYDAPNYPAILDQKDCKYQPRVVTVQVGQSLVARNSDPFFHNVHTNSRVNRPVNIAQPRVDPVGVRLKALESPETFKVTCDVHPWMVAWVAAFDHPYNAVTASDGAFKMPPLEPGTYTVRAWHERLGAVEQEIRIANDWSCPPIVLKFGEDRVAAAMADRMPVASAAGFSGGGAAGAELKPACCAGKK